MEILITIAYFFLVRLIFFDYKLLRFNIFWKMVVFGIYIGAILTEVILLGQYTPFSKELVVQNFTVQIAAEIGGEVRAVPVSANTPVRKGDVLIEMKSTRQQAKVAELEADVAAAKQNLVRLGASVDAATAAVTVQAELIEERAAALEVAIAAIQAAQADAIFAQQKYAIEFKDYSQGAGSKLRAEHAKRGADAAQADLAQAIAAREEAQVIANSTAGLEHAKAKLREAQAVFDSNIRGVNTSVAADEAQLAAAKFELDQRIIRAPSDGYVVNLQVRPGQQVRLKAPMMVFVSTEEFRLVSPHIQNSVQWIQTGDAAEIAFEMYPGQVFPAEVLSVVWATEEAQGTLGGLIKAPELSADHHFWVRLRRVGEFPDQPLRFGAVGISAIYTSKAADALQLIRKLEIRSESYLNYLFNPF